MIITRKQFEAELEKARNDVLRDVDYDRRFQELNNRCYDLERRMYELGCKIEKLQIEMLQAGESKKGQKTFSEMVHLHDAETHEIGGQNDDSN